MRDRLIHQAERKGVLLQWSLTGYLERFVRVTIQSGVATRQKKYGVMLKERERDVADVALILLGPYVLLSRWILIIWLSKSYRFLLIGRNRFLFIQ